MAQLRPAASDDELRRHLDRGLDDLKKLEAHVANLELPRTRAEVREIDRV
jgi:hypothetical protein